MNIAVRNFAETAGNPNLEGSWVKVLEARHYGNNVEFTPSDLDAMVRNYQSRTEDASVGVGPNWTGASVLGKVGDLRRNGNGLEAKLVNVSPDLQNFHGEANAFPKAAVAISKSGADGPSLQRVGFLREDGSWPKESNRNSPRTDARGNTEVTFSESSPASRAVSGLKASGHWRPVFDHFCIPHLFVSLQSSDRLIQFGEGADQRLIPAIGALAKIIEFVSDAMQGTDEDLHRDALRISRAKSISYGEALSEADKSRQERLRDAYFSEGPGRNCGGIGLDREARKRAIEEGISYGEALDRVAREMPELAR